MNSKCFRAKDVAYREKQLLSIAAWLTRFPKCELKASDFFQSSTASVIRRFLFSRIPALQHVLSETAQTPAFVPELNPFSLLHPTTRETEETNSLTQNELATSLSEILNLPVDFQHLQESEFLVQRQEPEDEEAPLLKFRTQRKRKKQLLLPSDKVTERMRLFHSCFLQSSPSPESSLLFRSYAKHIPKRPLFHLVQNLNQEVALVEHAFHLCRGNSEDSFFPKCIADVGGGNGYLVEMAEKRFSCVDSAVVIDPQLQDWFLQSDSEENEKKKKKKNHNNPYFRRVVKDINKVDLRADVYPKADDCVFLSKHLCGSGLCSLLRAFDQQEYWPRVLVLSSCCHFKAESHLDYVNQEFLASLHLRDERPFLDVLLKTLKHEKEQKEEEEEEEGDLKKVEDFLLSISSSYISKSSSHPSHSHEAILQSREKRSRDRIRQHINLLVERQQQNSAKLLRTEQGNEQQQQQKNYARKSRQKEGARSLFLSVASRTNWTGTHGEEFQRNVGLELENIFDSGRVEFLRRRGGYRAHIVEFCSSALSPRNMAICAVRPRNHLLNSL